MNLDKLIGGLLIAGFDGLTVLDHIREMAKKRGLAGVILFKRNIESLEQMVALSRELHGLFESPPLVSIDHEGGKVFRPDEPFTRFPGNDVTGRMGAEIVKAVGAAMARELKAVGINWNFAPVVDVNSNPDNPVIGSRSFGSDPELVGRMGCALIRGLQEEGVAACAKHFPGHGDTSTDSHKTLPVVARPRQDLEQIELPPFRKTIECGVASIMTAHVLYRSLDAARPATLSPDIIRGLLRSQMGYNGVVVSDDLEMKGIANDRSVADAAVEAIAAGVDVLLICRSADAQNQALDALGRAVRSGDLAEERVKEALARVNALASRFALSGPPELETARSMVGAEGHRVLCRTIEKSAREQA